MGTGGSFAGIWGVTVRCWDVEVLVDAGFAAVEVAAAAFGAVAYAARRVEAEKLRCGVRYAIGAALDDEAARRAEKPLRAGTAAIMNRKGISSVVR